MQLSPSDISLIKAALLFYMGGEPKEQKERGQKLIDYFSNFSTFGPQEISLSQASQILEKALEAKQKAETERQRAADFYLSTRNFLNKSSPTILTIS